MPGSMYGYGQLIVGFAHSYYRLCAGIGTAHVCPLNCFIAFSSWGMLLGHTQSVIPQDMLPICCCVMLCMVANFEKLGRQVKHPVTSCHVGCCRDDNKRCHCISRRSTPPGPSSHPHALFLSSCARSLVSKIGSCLGPESAFLVHGLPW